jgi:hypothetical protein
MANRARAFSIKKVSSFMPPDASKKKKINASSEHSV